MEYEDILKFWFTEVTPGQWFREGESLDDTVRDRFGEALENAKQGKCDSWAATPPGRLALIILLDQFSRHIFRHRAEAYAADARAQALTLEGIRLGMDRRLQTPAERHFFYMPLMHAEDRTIQALAMEKFSQTPGFMDGSALAFARAHARLIEQFGRFPHRNKELGRLSTPEEQAFVESNPGF